MNPLDYEEVSKCKLCPELGKNHCPSAGNTNADLVIVGHSPGDQEVIEKTPFCGPSGDLVNYMLIEAGIVREEVYIANTIKCQPPKYASRGGPNTLKASWVSNCWKRFLMHELIAVNPKLILLLGKQAHMAVLPARKEWGHLVVNRSRKRVFLSSYHPSYFLRTGGIETFVKVGNVVAKLLAEIEEKKFNE